MQSIALTLKRLTLCWERDLRMKYHEHHNQNSTQLRAMVVGTALRCSTKSYVDAGKIQQR